MPKRKVLRIIIRIIKRALSPGRVLDYVQGHAAESPAAPQHVPAEALAIPRLLSGYIVQAVAQHLTRSQVDAVAIVVVPRRRYTLRDRRVLAVHVVKLVSDASVSVGSAGRVK
ncbi:hypothetical protein ColLi_09126 [Colletotrichum liriopes]|uniref:Uncharacterized protein n=1 Tax=Colletotrichum liriopes TaxID=708192 RepID=A0AA37GUD3_9PEZI|nr:hypothetical protein ColLi_09126 [Colletotrichum liriopes]